MRVVTVTPPETGIELYDVRLHLGMDDGDSEDDEAAALYAAAAQAHLDGPGKWLGRSIGVQTLEARLDNFDCGSIRLPYPPVIEVLSVKYIDAAGVEQTVAADQYDLLDRSLVPAYGAAWPSPRWMREAVRIRYKAGYAELPYDLRAALLLMTADLFNSRESFVTGTIVSNVPMSTTVENLLASYRVFA